MLSLRTSMFSLLLLCCTVLSVFCQNPITNIRVLDSYLNEASKFVHNRPIFDGITLVLPKAPPIHSLRHPQNYHHAYHHHHHHPNLHQLQSHPIVDSDQFSPPTISPEFHQLLFSALERPDYPIFSSVIVPKNFNKYRKPKKYYKSDNKPKYYSPQKHYYKHKKYPKSINDRLREKDYENEPQEEDDKQNDNKLEDEEDPMDDPNKEMFEKPTSYYHDFPPFARPKSQPMKPVFEVNSQLTTNRSKDIESKERPQSYPHSEPQYSDQNGIEQNYDWNQSKKPDLQNDWTQNNEIDDNENSLSLFDRSPPFSNPDQFNFLKPMIQKNKDNTLLSDSPQMSNDYNNDRPKKERTATANQLSLKEKDIHSHKNNFKEDKREPVKVTQSIPKEDLESNDDPNFYPHQYAIEIRWKDRNNIHYNLEAPKGDVGDREMHSSKELDHARHRKYKHEEEEHWHEKKWLKEGLRQAYLNGKPLPVRIIKPTLNLPDGDFSPLPLYAQPLPNSATLDEINQHFAIPTPNFRVNTRFMEWAKTAIPLNPLQNINNYLLYG